MNGTKSLFIILYSLLVSATADAQEAATYARIDTVRTLSGRNYDPEGGADACAARGDNRHSAYYANPDFFNLTSNDTLTILPQFRTM